MAVHHRYGLDSQAVAATIHQDLRRVAFLALERHDEDLMLREGRRDRETQERYFAAGLSGMRWPDSMHNAEPPDLSYAVHILPYPIRGPEDWKDLPRFYAVAETVLQVAGELGVPLRWGGRWRKPHDPGHFEIAVNPFMGGE